MRTFQGVVPAHPSCAERVAGEAGDERVVARRVVLDCVSHAGEYLPFGDLVVVGVGPSGAEQVSKVSILTRLLSRMQRERP